jgi:hypothetical protein
MSFLLWRSISAEQPGGLDTKATGVERAPMVIVAGTMLTVSVQEYDIADVRPLRKTTTRERTNP